MTQVSEPNNVQEALSGPNLHHWQQPMNKESDSLIKHDTWKLVDLHLVAPL